MHDVSSPYNSVSDDDGVAVPIVLAAESDEDNLLLLMGALEELPCRVLAAVDGKRALSLAVTYRPALVLTEIILPSLDGFELLERLQNSPITQTTPVVAVTVMASEGDRSRILTAGFSSYLSKPYGIEDLRLLVRRYLL